MEENRRLTEELGECKFKLLSMGNSQSEISPKEPLRRENELLKEEIEKLREDLGRAKMAEQKLKEKEEEMKHLESAKRNMIGSFGSIGSNHRDSTGYMVLKNPSSDKKIQSRVLNLGAFGR